MAIRTFDPGAARLPNSQREYDSNFETKAAEIIGLYLDPPQHAAVFCVDDKTAIQALDRLDPVLPFSPGRAERQGFECHHHGTLSLYAALDTKTGKAYGKTAARHTSADFVGFHEDVVAKCPVGQEIHIILDNLSAHKTKLVDSFLTANPHVQLHFTPTYSSWLNQVEIWFSRIEREVICTGRVHLRVRFGPLTPPLHPGLLGPCQTLQVEILKFLKPYR